MDQSPLDTSMDTKCRPPQLFSKSAHQMRRRKSRPNPRSLLPQKPHLIRITRSEPSTGDFGVFASTLTWCRNRASAEDDDPTPAISRALWLAGHQLISSLPTAFPNSCFRLETHSDFLPHAHISTLLPPMILISIRMFPITPLRATVSTIFASGHCFPHTPFICTVT
jgi:hypothetical protein